MNDNFVSQLTDNCPQIIYIHSIIDNRRQNGIYIYISSGMHFADAYWTSLV